ncbi:MAG: hypothetical protein NVV59_20735 [Chitinophagaceae bacterium]|nr:hypothetical protein [Chitinophagaceae bacterium]
MRKSALLLVLLFLATQVISQSYKFNRSLILGIGNVRSILQDKEGYLWMAIQDGKAGLCKYDGKTQTTYAHDPRNSNTLSNNQVRSIAMDREGIIWIATYDGVNRLDPLTETITHFKHEANDPLRIHRDSITSVLVDHEGYVWAGTRAGLSKLDPKSGKFVSYSHDPSDPGSLSHYYVYTIYEDRQHQIWVGSLGGGLSVMDKETGKFKTYTRRDNDEHSINSDTVSAIFEDSRGTFWVGTQNNGICILDRNTGQFTRHLYDESKPNKLSVPVTRRNSVNYIPFIQEDKFGEIWIGSFYDGVIKYDPVTKKLMRYGNTQTATRLLPEDAEDSNKFPEFAALSFSQTDDGLIWIGCLGSTYTLTREPAKFPHYPLKTAAVNSFYEEENGGLWIGMQEGLLYKSPTGTKTFYQHNPKQPNSVADNIVNSLVYDGAGNLWVGTGGGGVDKLDLKTRKFVNYKISASGRVDSNIVAMLYLDDENILWVATNTGLGTLNIKTGSVNRFFHNPSNSNSLSNNDVYVVNGNKNEVWIGTIGGLDRLDKHTGNWRHYLPGSTIQSIFFDSKGELWVGSDRNLYRYKKNSDDFQLYVDSSTGTKPGVVLNIIEDLDHNLWVTSTDNIYRINSNRNALVVLGSKHGIHRNGLLYASNLLTKDGRLF